MSWHDGGHLRAACLGAALLALLAMAPRPAPASVLSLCEGPSDERSALALSYRGIDGSSRTLRLDETEGPEGCARLALPVAVEGVVAMALQPPTGDRAPETLALQGSTGAQGRFVIGQIEAGAGAAPALPMLPLGRDLLPRWTPRLFGAEERASLTRADGAITLSCRAGEQAAGLFASEGAALPPLSDLALAIDAQGDGGFVFAAADEVARRRDAPLPLVTLPRAADPHATRAMLAASLDRRSPLTWSVLCPRTAATLTLRRVALEPPSLSPRRAPPSRSAWAWQPRLWQETPAAFLDRLRAAHIDRVYVTVPLRGDESVIAPEKLRAFIEAAARQGVAVWAVEGDPHAVLGSERDKFRRRSAALAAYNRSHPGAAGLLGVQYDIEPYLVPGFALDPERWTAAYLETIGMLGAAAEMPVEVALPFWFPFDTWGAKLADVVGGIALMDYRTEAEDIERSALPALAWGTTYRRAVHIGLELGPLGDEQRRRYRRAESGELWRVSIDGQHALLLLRAPQGNPAGESYALVSESAVPGSSFSFNGREGMVDAILPGLVRGFETWPGYAGIALHGLF